MLPAVSDLPADQRREMRFSVAFCNKIEYAKCRWSFPVPRGKIKAAIVEFLDPIRKNNIEARRRKLGLSRAALGRILDVDPATVFRRERGAMAALWHYALRGIEAEAADSREILRSYKSDLDRQVFKPKQVDAWGYSYLGQKMDAARLEHARKRVSPPAKSHLQDKQVSQRAKGKRLSRQQINEIADRAEGRKG